MKKACVHTHDVGDVCVISIDKPPINASFMAVCQGLIAVIETLTKDINFKAGVIIGAGTTFVAGSDLREFGLPTAIASFA